MRRGSPDAPDRGAAGLLRGARTDPSPRGVALVPLLAGLVGLAAACGGEAPPAGGEPPELEVLFRVDSLEEPESVAWDAERERWLVTNQAGGEPGAGYVTAVSASGDSVVRRALGGPGTGLELHAPTGIVVRGDRAYVVDRSRLVAVDLTGGAGGWELVIPDAGFPNDVTLGPGGELYVSDTGAGAIWRVASDGSGLERLMPTVSMRSPNGLFVDTVPRPGPVPADEPAAAVGEHRLLVAGWEGTVMALNADSSVTLLAESAELERLDGIQPAPDGGLLVTDFARGRLQHLERGERRVWRAGVPWLTGLDEPADFLVRDTILALPETGAGRITFYRLPRG